MSKLPRPLCLALLLCLVAAPAVASEEIDIPYTKFVLDNGLTLIVHEDHKAPIVAVNVWYHVGSKNEKPGKTGFAHLFEHLMFNGSENHNDDYFKPFDRIGATDMNGTTNFDRTNYFQNVPVSALDVALWMESDRMGHLLGAIDQARLDEQRGVVQNEKRQGEDQPYGQAFRTIVENTYPQGHPYSWSVIGSLEDLDAASLDDVHEWFKSYYGAANAVLAIAGDVDTDEVHQKVKEYFGDIPSGPPVARHRSWVAKRTGTHRKVLQDRVPQARIYKVWNMPPWGSDASVQLALVNNLLTDGKNSRLYKRLVYQEQLATSVRGFTYDREIGGLFILYVTAQPGQELGKIERIIDEELRLFFKDGPREDEVERIKASYHADFVRGVERIGGFGGKSDILAQYEVYGGNPEGYKRELQRVAVTQPRFLRAIANEWLKDGSFVLEVVPFPEYATTESTVDRSALPEPGEWPEVRFPEMERAELSNGLQLILARRDAVPVVEFRLMLDAGYASDRSALPGTASLAMNILDEGTERFSSLQISQSLAMLGAELSTGSDLDSSVVTLSALTENLDASLDIFADVILNPAFDEKEFERLKKQQLARIQREMTTPRQMALRALPRLLYGDKHAYGTPLTGSGTEESMAAMKVADLEKFHKTWFDPGSATMIVVGDTTLEEIRPKLEERFSGWKPTKRPKKNVTEVKRSPSGIYLIDRPDSLQSVIIVGRVAPPKANRQEIAIEAMNEVLGGSFSARINMNLREDKHWSYGARSRIYDARGPRPFYVSAPVQTDKTKEAIVEIRKELEGIVGDRPPTAEELERAKDKKTLTLPGRWETSDAVVGSISDLVQFGLDENYWNSYPGRVRGLTLEEVSGAAETVVKPDGFVWIVVGDRSKVASGLRELGLGELQLITADGEPVEGDTKLAHK